MKLRNTKIIEKSNNDARKYFLTHKAYFTTDLPPYFSFTEILEKINDYFENDKIDDIKYFSKKITGDNKYTILTHKNQDNYRPISLINPVLYVYLVRIITEKNNWQHIQNIFNNFAKYSQINCPSLPIYTDDDKNKF
ncbi:MAG: cobalt transporter, partial [Proteobacteria bacterium]|nr:cobalt transporter [Pseudomonadota bacterium]